MGCQSRHVEYCLFPLGPPEGMALFSPWSPRGDGVVFPPGPREGTALFSPLGPREGTVIGLLLDDCSAYLTERIGDE